MKNGFDLPIDGAKAGNGTGKKSRTSETEAERTRGMDLADGASID